MKAETLLICSLGCLGCVAADEGNEPTREPKIAELATEQGTISFHRVGSAVGTLEIGPAEGWAPTRLRLPASATPLEVYLAVAQVDELDAPDALLEHHYARTDAEPERLYLAAPGPAAPAEFPSSPQDVDAAGDLKARMPTQGAGYWEQYTEYACTPSFFEGLVEFVILTGGGCEDYGCIAAGNSHDHVPG
jgi:hypothetical protein